MKKHKKIKINIIMKESGNFSPHASNNISIGEDKTLDMKPLFDFSEIFRKQNEDENTVSSTDEGYSELNYKKLSKEEKKLSRIYQVEIEPSDDLNQVMENLRKNPNVESAEINNLNELYFTPSDDPRYEELYGLKKIDCECAWEITEGEDVIVAVLDTGVDYNHPDIKDNMWKDCNENYGKDFSDGDDDPMDYHGHGTHVAGTIAATKDNNIGIVGVAPKVKIMAVKIFPQAEDHIIVKAIKYAVDNGAKIINNSWGPQWRKPSNPILEAGIDYAHSKGVICIFAAGNNNDETRFYSPANYVNTISVASTDANDHRSHFSNFGSRTDIAAPGSGILSLRFASTNYSIKSGTSMACPHVAGACALLLSLYPDLDFSQVKSRLLNSSDPINTDKEIAGRLNVCNLLNNKWPL